jgi:hypothetical protein
MAAGTLSLLPLMMYRRVLGDTPRAIYRAVCALILRFHQRAESAEVPAGPPLAASLSECPRGRTGDVRRANVKLTLLMQATLLTSSVKTVRANHYQQSEIG